jgi:RNA polymerase sigma factor (sigma-70 family)
MKQNEFIFNKIKLNEILNKIFVEKDNSYYTELLNDDEYIIPLVNKITNNYSYGNGSFFVSRDYIKGIVQLILCEITWRWFKPELCKNNLKDDYLTFLKINLPGKVYREICQEREKNNKENVVLYGSVDDLINIENEIIKDNNHQDNDEKFNETISICTARQKQILKLMFKERMTVKEISNKLNINHNTIRVLKKRAIKKIKRSFL